MDITELLTQAVQRGASDVFIVPGSAVAYKVNGEILPEEGMKMMPKDTYELISQLYAVAERPQFQAFMDSGDDDYSFSLRDAGRFRVNVYKQRGSLSAVIRVVPFGLPDASQLGIPEVVMKLGHRAKGLVLVTGPAGSGKSTTLACMIDQINHKRNCHVLTLEDPIEFLHRHDKAIVSQREISMDTHDYASALKAAMRQSPDVILVGEMRDLETIEIALTAAETGHLVLSTLHTIGAANTIDRIIDVFPAGQQQQIRVQLAMVLQGVVSQHLIPSAKLGRAAAFEVMLVNSAVRSMIRDSKLHQLESLIFSSGDQGMQTMDSNIIKLVRSGAITKEDALMYATNPEAMSRQI